ncbi:MAG: SGNH/GDSL hydrolase family protein [Planctomycetota bacterium]
MTGREESSRERGPLWRRAIRSRVLRLLLSALVILGLCHVLVEAFDLRFAQITAESSYRKLEVFRTGSGPIDVAFLGSSRMGRAVLPRVFEAEYERQTGHDLSTFNLSLHAGTTLGYYLVTRDLLNGEHRPKVLVVGLGARGFNSNSPHNEHAIRHLLAPGDLLSAVGPHDRAEVMIVPEILFRAPATLLTLWRWELPESRVFADDLLEASSNVSSRVALPGDFPLPMTNAMLEAAIRRYGLSDLRERVLELTEDRIRRAHVESLRDFDVNGRCSVAFERLLRICRERGIRLVAVNLPVSAEYARGAYRNGEYEKYLERARTLCRDGDVPFIDLAKDGDTEPLPLSLFRDGHHLNEIGSHYYSRLLSKRLSPLIEQAVEDD